MGKNRKSNLSCFGTSANSTNKPDFVVATTAVAAATASGGGSDTTTTSNYATSVTTPSSLTALTSAATTSSVFDSNSPALTTVAATSTTATATPSTNREQPEQEKLLFEQQQLLFLHIQQQQLQTQQEYLMQLQQRPLSLREWILIDKRGMHFVLLCLALGAFFGFVAGATVLEVKRKQALANFIRSTTAYHLMTGRISFYHYIMDEYVEMGLDRFAEWAVRVEREIEEEEYATRIGHPRVFAVLREAVVREPGGYVHPDLGFLTPAPCGAARGVGMVRDIYHSCQSQCFPGVAMEATQQKVQQVPPIPNRTAGSSSSSSSSPPPPAYKQEEILIIVPIRFQMRRKAALETLVPLLPKGNKEAVDAKASSSPSVPNIYSLDDAALLTLFLAHERGVGRLSRWMPYIATLPQQPMCGWSKLSRPAMLDAMRSYRREYSLDAEGWGDELYRATLYADRVAEALDTDYGRYIQHPPGVTSFENILWALCQVASRATAASARYGSLRLIPVIDLLNHDSNAGGLQELNGTELLVKGHVVNAEVYEHSGKKNSSALHGAFIVRSLRHGRRKPLKKGQELLITYNVPHYSPLDWFVSMGFVPTERWMNSWQKINPVLPRIATHQQHFYFQHHHHQSTAGRHSSNAFNEDIDGALASTHSDEQLYQQKEEFIQQKLKHSEL